MRKQTLFDLLGDPAGWAGIPAGFAPPLDVFMKSRLMKAWIHRGDLVVKVAAQQFFDTSFAPDSLDPFSPQDVVVMLEPYFGGLLLDALAHEIGVGA